MFAVFAAGERMILHSWVGRSVPFSWRQLDVQEVTWDTLSDIFSTADTLSRYMAYWHTQRIEDYVRICIVWSSTGKGSVVRATCCLSNFMVTITAETHKHMCQPRISPCSDVSEVIRARVGYLPQVTARAKLENLSLNNNQPTVTANSLLVKSYSGWTHQGLINAIF